MKKFIFSLVLVIALLSVAAPALALGSLKPQKDFEGDTVRTLCVTENGKFLIWGVSHDGNQVSIAVQMERVWINSEECIFIYEK